MPTSSQLESDKSSTETLTITPCRKFFDTHSFTIPSSLLDATTRLSRNITHYQFNYSSIILQICYLCIGQFVRPLALNLFLIYLGVTLTCYIAYARCSCSVLHGNILLGVVAVFSVFMFVVARAWLHLLVVLVISTAFVCLHGVFKDPSFDEYEELLDSQSSPQFDGGV